MQGKEEDEIQEGIRLKRSSKIISILTLAFILGAWNSEPVNTNTKDTSGEQKLNAAEFPEATSNADEAIKGGHLNYGLISDTPFEGILNWAFYQGQPDSEVLQFFDEALLATDENYLYNNDGAATYQMSEDNKTITIQIKDNVNWHDGAPVTGADLEYAYLVIGSPEYKGVRYDSQFQMIEGMEEYHSGTSDTISGIKVDGKTISITFKEANPSLLATGLWTYPLHKEYLIDVAIADLERSEKIRKKPIGFGPFKVTKIVQGEAVEYKANKDYWNGAPALDSLTLKVVNPDITAKSLETGEIDLAAINASHYDQVKKLNNVQLLAKTGFSYSYIGFKLGHFDAELGESVMDNPKFQDVRVRQAMAYAIDHSVVAENLYQNLRFPANTVIPTVFTYHNSEVKGYSQDIEKAKSLLDEAGFVDTNNDGYREDADGKEFVINFLSMSGDSMSEPLSLYYIQQWGEVGLKVKLLEGRLHEFNSFYQRVETDDPAIDIYQAAWGTGTDPDPSGLWAKDAPFNYTRWVNEKNEELLAKGISPAAFDEGFRKEVYDEWQQLIHDEVPLIPTLFRYELMAVNKRVKDFNYLSSETDWSKVAVTKEEPVK
jgi:peptide/nickel transport system substrate-binding protein